MSAKKIDPNALKPEKPRSRRSRLQKRLREINAYGEQELQAIMDSLEKIKDSFRSQKP